MVGQNSEIYVYFINHTLLPSLYICMPVAGHNRGDRAPVSVSNAVSYVVRAQSTAFPKACPA